MKSLLLRPLALVLVLVLILSLAVATLADDADANKAVMYDETIPSFYHDFRKRAYPNENFMPAGPNAAGLVKAEEEGLRITLPAKQDKPEPAGVRALVGVKGDFEITAGYEFLQADAPKTGTGIGFEIYLETSSPTKEGLGFIRVIRPNGSDVYAGSRRTTNSQGKRAFAPGLRPLDMPAEGSKTGRLRVTRHGTEVVLYAAEPADGNFREYFRLAMDAEPVSTLRLAAHPGTAPNPVDLRITDFRVRNVLSPKIQSDSVDPKSNNPVRSTFRWWLAGAIMLALAIAAAALWVWMAMKGKKEPPAV